MPAPLWTGLLHDPGGLDLVQYPHADPGGLANPLDLLETRQTPHTAILMPDSPGQVHSLPGLYYAYMPARPPETPAGAAAGRRGIRILPTQGKPPRGAHRAHSGLVCPHRRSGYSFPEGRHDIEKPRRSRQALPGLFRWFGRSPISQRSFLRPSEEFQELRFLSLLRFLEVLQRYRLRQDTSV